MLQVVIGAGHRVAQHSRISLCQQAEASSSLSDDELEYAAAGSIAGGQASQPFPVKGSQAGDDASSDSSDNDASQYQPTNGSSLEKPQPKVIAAARAVSDRDDRQQGLHTPLIPLLSGLCSFIWNHSIKNHRSTSCWDGTGPRIQDALHHHHCDIQHMSSRALLISSGIGNYS